MFLIAHKEKMTRTLNTLTSSTRLRECTPRPFVPTEDIHLQKHKTKYVVNNYFWRLRNSLKQLDTSFYQTLLKQENIICVGLYLQCRITTHVLLVYFVYVRSTQDEPQCVFDGNEGTQCKSVAHWCHFKCFWTQPQLRFFAWSEFVILMFLWKWRKILKPESCCISWIHEGSGICGVRKDQIKSCFTMKWKRQWLSGFSLC